MKEQRIGRRNRQEAQTREIPQKINLIGDRRAASEGCAVFLFGGHVVVRVGEDQGE